jgi:hypothetical protein
LWWKETSDKFSAAMESFVRTSPQPNCAELRSREFTHRHQVYLGR